MAKSNSMYTTFGENTMGVNVNFQNYINSLIRTNKVLSYEDERALILKAKNGDEKAKTKVLMSNILYYYKVARHYHAKFPNLGIEDLFSEIYMGAEKSFDSFDLKHQARFISWATGYMKNAVIDYARRHLKLVKVPIGFFKKANQYFKLSDKLGKLNAKESLDLSEFEASGLEKNYLKDSQISNTDVVDYEDNKVSIVANKESAEEDYEKEELKRVIRKALNLLDEKEKDIVVKAFGIDSPKMPITSIANEYQTNNRRINLIINASLKKMKNAEIREYQK